MVFVEYVAPSVEAVSSEKIPDIAVLTIEVLPTFVFPIKTILISQRSARSMSEERAWRWKSQWDGANFFCGAPAIWECDR
jgi:hypothetical protein